MSKSIMILGTSSGAGKSTVTTGLARILLNDGYTVAPYKAQNMSNNGHILDDATEMARSQAVQAFACKIEPSSDMNPVLLKIVPDGIEVIVRGKKVNVMTSEEYIGYKKDIWPSILEPLNNLRSNYDIVVMEGAGSPVEMNLKSHDIVNINMAKRSKSPVLLVADIDRGGVFASIYGTLMLLSEEERGLIKGIILNRLRGKSDHYKGVKEAIEDITGVPVVAMIPYLDIKIEDEDSLIDAHTGVKPPISMEKMEVEFEKLSKHMKEHMDMKKIYKIIETGVESEY